MSCLGHVTVADLHHNEGHRGLLSRGTVGARSWAVQTGIKATDVTLSTPPADTNERQRERIQANVLLTRPQLAGETTQAHLRRKRSNKRLL